MKQYKLKESLKNVFPCLSYGIICGSITGLIIFLFKFAAKNLEKLSRFLYSAAKESSLYVAVVFIVLVFLAVLMIILHRIIPEAKGGGIPRSEGVIRGILPFRSLKTFFGVFSGSMISFFAGLPHGTEGPAVLLGTSIGGMCSNLSKNKGAWGRYIMSGGAGAGFAVATGAPLSAILFVFEEIHKKLAPMQLLIVSFSVISASCVNRFLCFAFDMESALISVDVLPQFELVHIGYLLILGVVIAVAAAAFDFISRFFFKIHT